MTRRALTAVLLVCLGGCSFKSSVPDGLHVVCSADSPVCPVGYTCRAAANICVLDNAKATLPALTNVSVSPSAAKTGSVVTVAFQVTKPLAKDPVVTLNAGSISEPLKLKTSDGGVYAYALTITGEEAEGSAEIQANIVDVDGDALNNVPLASVLLELQAPSLVSASVVTPLESGNPIYVKPSDVVRVRVHASGPVLSDGLDLVASSTTAGCASFSYALAFNNAGVLNFQTDATSPTSAGQAGCSYTLALHGVTDAAGNVAASMDLGITVVVLSTSPHILDIATFNDPGDGTLTPAATFSRVAGHNTLVTVYSVDAEAVPVLSAQLGGTELGACENAATACSGSGPYTCECRYTVSASDSEGPTALQVTAADFAGNADSAAAVVQFDFTAPTQAGAATLTIEPAAGNLLSASELTALGPMGVANVQFQLSEPTSANPTLAAAGCSTPSLVGAANPFFTYAIHVADAGDGPANIQVTATDEAGNSGTFTLNAQLPIKTSVPAAPGVDVPDQVQYTRVPWGSLSTSGAPTWTVSAFAGTFATNGYAAVLSRPGTPLMHQAVTTTSSVTFTLPAVDAPTVWLALLDSAGNSSQPVLVQDSLLVASLAPPTQGAPSNLNGFYFKPVLDSPSSNVFTVPSSRPSDVNGATVQTFTGQALVTPNTSVNPDQTVGTNWAPSGTSMVWDPQRDSWVGWGAMEGWIHPQGGFLTTFPFYSSAGPGQSSVVTYANGAWNLANSPSASTPFGQWMPIVFDPNRNTVVGCAAGTFVTASQVFLGQLTKWNWPLPISDAGQTTYALSTDGSAIWTPILGGTPQPAPGLGGAFVWSSGMSAAVLLAADGTWSLDGVGWNHLEPSDGGPPVYSVELAEGGRAPKRSMAGAIEDPATHAVWLMGGEAPGGAISSEMWEFVPTGTSPTGYWQLSSTQLPAPNSAFGLFNWPSYVSGQPDGLQQGGMVMLGGNNPDAGRAYHWNGSDWESIPTVDEFGLSGQLNVAAVGGNITSAFFDPVTQTAPVTQVVSGGSAASFETEQPTVVGTFDWMFQTPAAVFQLDLSNMGVPTSAWTEVSASALAGGSGQVWAGSKWQNLSGVSWWVASNGQWVSPTLIAGSSGAANTPQFTSALLDTPAALIAGAGGPHLQIALMPQGMNGPTLGPDAGAQVGVAYMDVSVRYHFLADGGS